MVDEDRQTLSDPTRRALLGTTAAGAASLAAGCSGGGGDGGDGTPTQTPTQGTTQGTGTAQGTPTPTTTQGPLPKVEGQTLNWFMGMNPQDITWFGTGVFPGPQGKWALSRNSMAWDLTMETALRGPWQNLPIKAGQVHNQLISDFTVEPNLITVNLREDANWSNGDPVTPGDALGSLMGFRMFLNVLPPSKVAEEGAGDLPTDAITDFEIVDDKTFKLHSVDGWFDKVHDHDIYQHYLQRLGSWAGVRQNTSREPWKTWWETMQDWWDQTKNGEIDPYGGGFNIFLEARDVMFGDHGWSADPEKNNYDHHWEKKYSKPENIMTVGAWDVESINGQQGITLTPNEEHYARDQLNYETLELTVRQSERASRSAIKAGKQDYYRGTVPNYIVQSFPDSIEERQIPSNGGLAYGFDFSHPLFANRKARQAIMHAIDRERIGKSVHQTKYNPVTYVGAHGYRASDLLGEDWITNNLIEYTRDLDRANSLMEEAGFSKEGGKWVDGEGNPLSVTIPTAESTPTLGPAFANQLSQFGIDASLQTYSGSVFAEKKNSGELDIWSTNRGIGYMLSVARFYQLSVVLETWAKNWYNLFPEEQINETGYAATGIITPATSEGFGHYTLDAPPVGDRDGDLQTYNITRISWDAYRANDQQEYVENLKTVSWVFNWHVPMFPIANGTTQNFVDSGHWIWPATDSPNWEGVGVQHLQPEHLVGTNGLVHANPDNPEEGASVQNS